MSDLRAVIGDIKQRLDLRSILPNVRKQGSNHMCCCPIHDDSTPSMVVHQTYAYCFGCQASFDVIGWYEKHLGCTFIEALRCAALEAGVDIDPSVDSQVSKMVEAREKRHEELDLYHQKLEESEKAQAYLKGRGLTDETIKHFGLGYRPTWYNNTHADSIAVPIYSKSGSLDSISYRFLDPNDKQRYHHQNNEWWRKGDCLYHAQAVEFGEGPIYVCEGMFDVMSVWQAGMQRVVGVMGGTLNDYQVREFGESPVVFIPDRKSDNDYAIFKKSVFRLRNSHPNLVIRVAILPEGDANSVDVEVLKAACESAESAELSILKADLDDCGDVDTEYKVARQIATDINDPLTKDDIIKWLAKRWDKNTDVVKQALTRSDDSPITRVKTISDAMNELEESERAADLYGLAVKNLGIDRFIDRPRTGQIMLVAARPGVGKTLFALNVLYNSHKEHVPTLFISQEQPAKELGYRLCLMLGGDTGKVDNPTLRHNIIHDTDWWKSHRAQLEEMMPHVRIDARRLSPKTVRDSIIDSSYSMGEAVKVVIIDYLGLLRDDGRSNTAYERASKIATDIQDATKEIDYLGIYPIQVSREGGDGSERLTYDMNRDSGVFEEVADYWVGLWRNKKNADALSDIGFEQIDGNVGKNRHGKMGDFSLLKDTTTLRMVPMDGSGRDVPQAWHSSPNDDDEKPVDPFGG